MILDHQQKFAFIAIPKTACTSVQRYFDPTEQDPEPPIYHMDIATMNKQNPEVSNYYKFAFVRNPWDRFVSAYYNFTQDSGHFWWSHPLLKYKNFEDFCLNFENCESKNLLHFRTQFSFISIDEKNVMDYIGKYENLNDDFNKIKNYLNIDNNKSLGKHRVSKHENYTHLYTEEMKKVVERVYSQDIETFDYSFGK